MDRQTKTGLGILAAGCVLVVSACGQSTSSDAAATSNSRCVDIPDGYYLFTDGKFSPTSQELALEEAPEVTQAQVAWTHDIENDLAVAGFDWITLDVSGPVATVIGTAPTAAIKQAGLDAAEAAIQADRQARLSIRLVVDGIGVEGVAPGVGAAVANLSETPTPEACQAAFEATMEGRNIEFQTENSSISPPSTGLLDAIAGAALLCSDYRVEIGAHTDARGADSYNLRLSQERADAVRAYLLDKGVSGDKLTAVGYGETRPIDREQTSEAYARNRRTEFNIQPD